MISKGNHVKFACFVLLAASEKANTCLHFFLFTTKKILDSVLVISRIIIKITISLIVIGLKNSYFPLIHFSSCYRTVCYQTVQ